MNNIMLLFISFDPFLEQIPVFSVNELLTSPSSG